jgi:hypothetical protein
MLQFCSHHCLGPVSIKSYYKNNAVDYISCFSCWTRLSLEKCKCRQSELFVSAFKWMVIQLQRYFHSLEISITRKQSQSYTHTHTHTHTHREQPTHLKPQKICELWVNIPLLLLLSRRISSPCAKPPTILFCPVTVTLQLHSCQT